MYMSEYQLDDGVMIELYIYTKNGSTTLEIALTTPSSNTIHDFSQETRKGKVEFTFLLDDGMVLDAFVMAYSLWWDEQSTIHRDDEFSSILIQHEVLTSR